MLSESIAEGFSKYGSTDTVETQRFTRMFDQFFDCLNVRHPDVHIKRRKPNLKPYSRPDDERLKVSNTPHTHTNLTLILIHSGWRIRFWGISKNGKTALMLVMMCHMLSNLLCF